MLGSAPFSSNMDVACNISKDIRSHKPRVTEASNKVMLKHAYSATGTGLQISVRNQKLTFLFLSQNICCGYSKELSQRDGSFEHPKQMFKLMDKKILTILGSKFLVIWRPE